MSDASSFEFVCERLLDPAALDEPVEADLLKQLLDSLGDEFGDDQSDDLDEQEQQRKRHERDHIRNRLLKNYRKIHSVTLSECGTTSQRAQSRSGVGITALLGPTANRRQTPRGGLEGELEAAPEGGELSGTVGAVRADRDVVVVDLFLSHLLGDRFVLGMVACRDGRVRPVRFPSPRWGAPRSGRPRALPR